MKLEIYNLRMNNFGPSAEKGYPEIKALFHGYPVIIFHGDSESQDIVSGQFILNELACKLGDCYFIISGNVCNAISEERKPPNVILIGPVEPVEKQILFSIADVGVKLVPKIIEENIDISLTPRARQIYQNLKKAISQQQAGGGL